MFERDFVEESVVESVGDLVLLFEVGRQLVEHELEGFLEGRVGDVVVEVGEEGEEEGLLVEEGVL